MTRAIVLDRAGDGIEEGDRVELVYGGDFHEMVVESTEHKGENMGAHTITGVVRLTVPAAGVRVIKKARSGRHQSPTPQSHPRATTRKERSDV